MIVTITDMILLLAIAGFAFSGFWFGFIRMLGGLLGLVAVAIVSANYFEFIAEKLSFLFGGSEMIGKVIAFVLIFAFVTTVVSGIFWIINKLFNLLSIIPFLKTINRLAGAILGFIEGIALFGIILFFAVRYPLGETITSSLSSSIVVDWLLGVANRVAPLLPDFVDKAQAMIGG